MRASAADANFFFMRFQDSLENGRRAIELGERVDDLPTMVMAHFYTARALDFIGGLEEARQHSVAILSAAETLADLRLATRRVITSSVGTGAVPFRGTPLAVAGKVEDPGLALLANQLEDIGDSEVLQVSAE